MRGALASFQAGWRRGLSLSGEQVGPWGEGWVGAGRMLRLCVWRASGPGWVGGWPRVTCYKISLPSAPPQNWEQSLHGH